MSTLVAPPGASTYLFRASGGLKRVWTCPDCMAGTKFVRRANPEFDRVIEAAFQAALDEIFGPKPRKKFTPMTDAGLDAMLTMMERVYLAQSKNASSR